MKIAVYAVGRMKAGPEKELADRYFDRFAKSGPAIGLEFSGVGEFPESRAARRCRTPPRGSTEAAGAAGARRRCLFLLDERGKNISSEQFSEKIAGFRDGGQRNLAIAIGGPDGHDPALHQAATLVLSFGALTWPHQLVRIMLAEQLYRTATILSGHPYHRA